MRYTDTLRESMHIADVCLCRSKQIALTKNGKEYGNLVMQNKTDTIDAKIWDLGSPGIGEFEIIDYAHVGADVILFQSSFQLNIRRIRRAQEGEHVEADYLPVSKKDIKRTYGELLGYIRSVKNPYLQKLLNGYFVENATFAKALQFHSATKTVHHGFVDGLLEHTLSVTKLYDYYAGYYPMINRDLLLAAATLHDVGKARELSRLPKNDYADDEQLLGHIIIGTEMVGEGIRFISEFPKKLATELRHCILAHHGESEYGSPKEPALLGVLALNFVDNTDAKMETMIEALQSGGENKERLGYNRLLEPNVRKTTEWALRLDNIER